ncbi:MAG: SPOR domain-containing protein [Acidobacteria bacterium]|nr:SPOR domain-containing protein [Acidobacteriota bacterium]
MPDLRDDTTDDGFHEIQLSRKQLVFLFMVSSVALILVFLFGVLVGRGTTFKEPEVSIASDQSAEIQSTPPEDPKPIPAEDPAGAPPAGPLSYPTVLTDKTSDVPAAPKPTVEPPAAAPADEPKAPAVKPDAPVARPADTGLNVPTSGKPGQWVIQVAALKTRRAAAESVQRLIGKGYDAYLEDTAKGLYRVRIGKFKDRDDALRVARRLEKEEGTKSVVSR